MAAWAAAAAVWLLVIGLAAPGVLQRAPSLAFPSFALDLHAAQPWRYVALPDDHALLGTPPLSPRGAGAVEQQLALGWSVLILALVGLIVPVPHDHRWRRLRPALVVTAAAAVLCSLPPTLAIGSAMLPMPSQALHALAPMFRAFARFGVLVSLGVSVLAGAGATWLFTRRSRQTRALAATLVAVAAIEYFPPRPLSRDVLPTAMHRAMAAATGARVLDCTKPTTGATAGLGLLMQPEVVIAAGALADCAEPQFGAKLAAFGFTHLIVRRDADPLGVLATGASPPGTTRQAGDTSAALYEVVAPRPDVYLIALEGFSTREFRAGDTWRWMGSSASVTLANLTSGPLPAMLELELEPFAGARSIEVRSHTGWLGAMTVDRRERFRLGPIPVEPGETTVTLTADRVVAPAEVGAGADPRPLSVRLRGWRVAATERQP